ncbi:MAG: TonB family protein [Bacteroidota bacterium]
MNIQKNNWESPSSEARLSTVFANRNQLYGAYVLRRDYDQTILRAFAITLIAGTILATIPLLKSYFFTEPNIAGLAEKEIVMDMVTPDAPIQPEEVKKPESNPTPNESNTVRDVTPVVVNHPTTDTTHTQSDLSNLNTGLHTTNIDSTNNRTTEIDNTKKGNDNSAFVFHGWVEVMPSFPGGETEMMKYLGRNLKYPERAKDAEAQGTVLISFIVDKEGNISNPTVKRAVGFGCEEEAIRVIQNMPAWTPGKMNGQKVNVEYVLPIRFTLR